MKIESICPCHTPNRSTKFRPNPSKTFGDIVSYIGLALSLNGEESLKKLSDPDPELDLHQKWTNSSLSYTQQVHQVSSESVHNCLRYHALYRFWPSLSQWWWITKKILVVGSGTRSSSKAKQFVLVTHRTCPQNFIRIHPQLFEIPCTQTDKQEEEKVQSTILAKSIKQIWPQK